LLILVINLTDGKKELYQLCRTSKLLRSIAEPLLYQLHFCNSELARKQEIRIIIQHPRFEVIVNTISINLYGWESCSLREKLPRYLKFLRSRDPCSCNALDKTVGRSLASLISLRTLRICCYLCPVERSYERHAYLGALKTRSLDTIRFICNCATKYKQDKEYIIGILTAPCMTSVTSLTWISGRTLSRADSSKSLINQDMLPNLRHLHHTGEDLHNLLLQNCSTTRLSATLSLDSGLNYDSLKMNRHRLTHLSVGFSWNSRVDLFRTVAHDTQSFRNLQHLGTFVLRRGTCLVSLSFHVILLNLNCAKARCEELLGILTQYSDLKMLISVDARINKQKCISCDDYPLIFMNGLSQISKLFPKLRRLFLIIPESWTTDIWVFSEHWECKAKGCRLDNYAFVNHSNPPPWAHYIRE
jgi:hypothetical protein